MCSSHFAENGLTKKTVGPRRLQHGLDGFVLQSVGFNRDLEGQPEKILRRRRSKSLEILNKEKSPPQTVKNYGNLLLTFRRCCDPSEQGSTTVESSLFKA